MLNARVERGVTEGIGPVFADAARTVPVTETAARGYIHGLMERARRGDLGIYTLLAGGHAGGVILYQAIDGDADLVFGHVTGGGEALLLGRAVDGLFRDGMHTVRSNFTWPDPRGFIPAARAMGFVATERMGMCRTPGPATPSCRGFDLLPWSDTQAGAVCRIMCQNQAPADLPVYPVFSQPDGARALMDSVLAGRHGPFLRDLSYVAAMAGRPVGFILGTRVPGDGVLILDLGVEAAHRKMGIGGALLDALIGAACRGGYGEIVLAVTAQNHDAIRLYESRGFRVNGHFRQHVLSKVSPAIPSGGIQSR